MKFNICFMISLFLYSLSLMTLIMLLISINWNTIILETEFMNSYSFSMNFTLIMDWMSISFFFHITLISACVSLYSSYYMKGDPLIQRFMLTILLFVSSMALMVFSLNLISILIGWDGLGLTSYILVTFYQNHKSGSAGMITALSNRIGDSALITSIAIMSQSQSWNFILSPPQMMINPAAYLIILAAMTKSAQMPFSAWLPAAMAAPTPVSALVHSSTLVTAGIYLMIRFHPLIMKSQSCLPLFLIGMTTTLMASSTACMESDLKKVIALSTLSQLGLMTSTIAIGMKSMAFFHLVAHATFKALLFMASGKIIHESNSQDMRHMGYFSHSLPLTSMSMNTANLALCGMPFLSGFYSKDLIIESFIDQNHSTLMYSMFFISLGLSSTYSIRLSHLSILNNSNQNVINSSSEDLTSSTAMLMLIMFSILSGSVLSWYLFPSPACIYQPLSKKLIPLMIMSGGGMMSILMSQNYNWSIMKWKINEPMIQMFFLTQMSGNTLSSKSLNLTNKTSIIDNGWFETLSSQGMFTNIKNYSAILTKTQNQLTKLLLTIFSLSLMIMLIL